MAGFRTHITTSTVLGIGYGVGGYFLLNAPPEVCLLSFGMCSVSGMLPDIDSDKGVPLRESMAFLAAVVPMFMLPRFQAMELSPEMMVLCASAIYLGIRFGLTRFLQRYTVHRGMWHSIPAAAIAGLIAFLVVSGEQTDIRLFKAGAVVAGFLSHLVLDEFYSFEVTRGKLRVKKSFGTALKFWGKKGWGNVSVYAKLLLLIALATGDPMFMSYMREKRPLHQIARLMFPNRARDSAEQAPEDAAGNEHPAGAPQELAPGETPPVFGYPPGTWQPGDLQPGAYPSGGWQTGTHQPGATGPAPEEPGAWRSVEGLPPYPAPSYPPPTYPAYPSGVYRTGPVAGEQPAAGFR